jgi:hypothetical protein
MVQYPIQQFLRIRATDDFPLEIHGIRSNLDQFIAWDLGKSDDGYRYRLKVFSTAQGPVARRGYLWLNTNHPKVREITLPVTLRLTSELEVQPERIHFGKVSVNRADVEHLKQVLTIAHHRGAPFHLEEVRYNEDYFQVEVEPLTIDPVSRYRLKIMPRLDRLPAGKISHNFVIKTDSSHAKELTIPVTIKVVE